MVVVDRRLLGLGGAEVRAGRVEHIGKHVAQGHEPRVGIGVQGVDGGSGSTPAAADQADAQDIAAGGVPLRAIGRPAASADPSSAPDCWRKPRREGVGRISAEDRRDMVGSLFERVAGEMDSAKNRRTA